jgi:hypothetical protein
MICMTDPMIPEFWTRPPILNESIRYPCTLSPKQWVSNSIYFCLYSIDNNDNTLKNTLTAYYLLG